MSSVSAASGRVTGHLVIVILFTCFGSNFQFYSNSVINNLADICHDWINVSIYIHYGRHITSQSTMSLIWSICSASLQIGCMIGVCFIGTLADRYGRLRALMITNIGALSGSLLNAYSKSFNSIEMFILGRLLMGVSLGSGLPLASIFITEISPIRYRGACGATQQIFVGLGNVISFLLTLSQIMGNEKLWPIAVSVPPFVASLCQVFILFLYAHESPRFLVLCRDKETDGALEAMKFYQGKNGAEIRLKAIQDEKSILDKQCKNGNGNGDNFRFVDLVRNAETRRPLVISMLIILGVQMSGVAAVFSYSKTMFTQAGLDDITGQYASLGIGFCNFFSPFLTMFLIERAGRRFLLITGLLLVDAALMVLTACLIFSNIYGWTSMAIGTVPCLFIFQISFSLAASVAMIVPAELFPQNSRGLAITLVFFFSWFLQTLCCLCYLPFAHFVGISYSFTPFIISVTISVSLLTFIMPETKGKTVQEVALMFANKTSPQEKCKQDILKF